jgi:hypothetical protein
MNTQMFLTAISLLLVGIFSIATSSIAIECYDYKDTTKAIKDAKKDNYTFVIVNLVFAILMVLVSFASAYFAISG